MFEIPNVQTHRKYTEKDNLCVKYVLLLYISVSKQLKKPLENATDENLFEIAIDFKS